MGNVIAGVYENQTQLFSKKIKINEVRIYTEPLVANNAFKIELIGSGGSVISNSSQTFTAGTSPISIGDDMVEYNPKIAPTYAIGVRITNSGTANWVGVKLELDWSEGGK